MARWLRRKNDGVIYGWHESLAKQPELEEVSEKEAWPEWFTALSPEQEVIKEAKELLNVNLGKGLDVPPEYPSDIPLRKEASKKLPK